MIRKRYLSLLLLTLFLVFSSRAQDFETPEQLFGQIMEQGEWFQVGLRENHVTAMKLDPNNPMMLYVGTIPDPYHKIKGKIFRSSNAGITWAECVDNVSVIDIDIDLKTPGIVLATSKKQTGVAAKLYKSDDFGKSWREIKHPLYNNHERPVFTRISPWNSSEYFGATTSSDKGYLYVSPDSGNTWQDITYSYFEGSPIDIAFNPFVENDIIISINNHTERPPLMRSLDDGRIWKHMRIFSQDIVDFIKFDPDSAGTIHAGLRGKGLYTSYDNGESWYIRDKGLKKGTTPNDIVVMNDGYYAIVSAGVASEVFCMKNNKNVWDRINLTRFGNSPQLERYKDFLFVGSQGVQVYWVEKEDIRKVEY